MARRAPKFVGVTTNQQIISLIFSTLSATVHLSPLSNTESTIICNSYDYVILACVTSVLLSHDFIGPDSARVESIIDSVLLSGERCIAIEVSWYPRCIRKVSDSCGWSLIRGVPISKNKFWITHLGDNRWKVTFDLLCTNHGMVWTPHAVCQSD